MYINLSQPTQATKDPYAKFRFPRVDPEPCRASKVEISPLESLSYLVNVACHRLEPDLKELWDEMIGRDAATPEISRAGMLLTSYDIRKLSGEFKKEKSKEQYVKSLKDKLSQENMDFYSTELFHNAPRFRTPSDGILCEFLVNYNTTQKLITKFEALINEMQFSFLFSLLDQIKLCLIFKKDVKKVERFSQLMKKVHPHKFKINFYLRHISRAVLLTEKHGKIKIQSLNLQQDTLFLG